MSNNNVREAQAEAARKNPGENLLETQCMAYLDPAGQPTSSLVLLGGVDLTLNFPLNMPNGEEYARLQQAFLGSGFAAPYVRDQAALPAISFIPTQAGNNRGTVREERTLSDLVQVLAHHSANPLNLSPEARSRMPVVQGLDYMAFSHSIRFQDHCAALVAELYPDAANWRPYEDAIDVIELPGGRGNPALAGQAYRKADGSVWVTPTGAEWKNVRPALSRAAQTKVTMEAGAPPPSGPDALAEILAGVRAIQAQLASGR